MSIHAVMMETRAPKVKTWLDVFFSMYFFVTARMAIGMVQTMSACISTHTNKFGWGGLLLFCCLLNISCSSIPHRQDEIRQQYPARAATTNTPAPALASVYHEYAHRAATLTNGTHYAQILATGDDALLVQLHLIRSAQHTIDIQTFIWKQDPVTRVLFDELCQAAERGVDVRLLVDAIYPLGKPTEIARMATAHERIQICLFNPVSPSAAVGLLDYARAYFDRDPDFLFMDRDVLVIGPVVADAHAAFNSFWTHRKSVHAIQFTDVRNHYHRALRNHRRLASATDRDTIASLNDLANEYDPSTSRPRLAFHTVHTVSFIADRLRSRRHMRLGRELTTYYRHMMATATERIVLQTPYLIYDRFQRRDIRKARKANPQLRVIVSSNSLAAADHVHVYAISYKHRRALTRHKGMDIYEFRPVPGDVLYFVPRYEQLSSAARVPDPLIAIDPAPLLRTSPRVCIHAKTLVVDGHTALVGSHNFDPRSSHINAESALLFEDEAFAQRIESEVLLATEPQNSWVVARTYSQTGLWGSIQRNLNAFSSHLPFLDIVPQNYVSLYHLKPDHAPVSRNHPNFYEIYEPVGQFPEVDDAATLRRVRFIKMFGGWIRPLL